MAGALRGRLCAASGFMYLGVGVNPEAQSLRVLRPHLCFVLCRNRKSALWVGAARALVVHCGRLIFGARECGVVLCVYVALPVKVKGTVLDQRYRRGGRGFGYV